MGVWKRREQRGGEGDWRRTGTNEAEAGEESLLERGGGERFLLPFPGVGPIQLPETSCRWQTSLPPGAQHPQGPPAFPPSFQGATQVEGGSGGTPNAGVVSEQEME